MDAADYERERHECRRALARRLRWENVPDDVWGHVDGLGLVYLAITGGDEEWEQLETAARTYRSGRPDASADGQRRQADRKHRRDTEEIEVELDGYTRLRNEVVAEMAAARPDVRAFRNRFLNGRLLSDQEADEFLWADGIAHRRLKRLARELARSYRWPGRPTQPERPAQKFVLTGRPPAPVYLSVAFGGGKAQIWIGAEPWVGAKEVAAAYRAAQQHLSGGVKHRIPAHHLELFQFVRRHTRQDGSRPKWEELRKLWNEEHPERPYKGRSGLFQAYKEASEGLANPAYNPPQWKRRDSPPTDTT
jgi:hypothetical protein